MVSEKLDIPYFYFAKKPFKKGFKKAIKLLEEKQEKKDGQINLTPNSTEKKQHKMQ